MLIPFTKMHGLGNDFILVDNLEGSYQLSKEQIAALCAPHTGIGADGLILVEQADGVDCFMNYHNADGSVAEMCGNGIRCAAKFFMDISAHAPETLAIGTRAGTKSVRALGDDMFAVDMGVPVFEHADFPSGDVPIEGLHFACVSMGNPHAVTFVDDLTAVAAETLGPIIERSPLFPNKINVEFVQKIRDDYLSVVVWERGSGLTLACGTGACAVFAVARKKDLVSSPATIELPGGALQVEELAGGSLLMTGAATRVFEGSLEV